MNDRRKTEFETLLSLPPRVGMVGGVLAYIVIGHLLPALVSTETTVTDVTAAMRPLALLALAAGVALAATTFLYTRNRKHQFEQRHGLASLRRLSRSAFAALIVEAFRRRGYEVVEQSYEAVDLVLLKDGHRYFVQFQHWKLFNVGVKPLRELHSCMVANGVPGAFFISSGVHTRDARVFAAESSIELIGGTTLQTFIESDLAPTSARPYPEPVFLSSTAMTVPVCPSCGNPMMRRIAKFGRTAGQEFWGCGQFPMCRGTRGL